jgi:hypothetical protein
MTDTCYFCGSVATSVEHVPPACLFPEQKDLDDDVDYRKNLITVPSCDEHNSHKSKDDEYVQLILVNGYFNNKAGQDHFSSKIVRAMSRRPALLAALYADADPVTIDGIPTVAINIDRERFNRALERIVKGLCVKLFGERWPNELEIHTPVLLAMDEPDADQVNSLVADLSKSIIWCLEGAEKHGENQDIFWCQLLMDKAKDRLLCRMVFYGGFNVFAVSDRLLQSDRV